MMNFEAPEVPGHRILREFLAFPENLLFVEIKGLRSLREMTVQRRFELLVDFGNRVPSGPMREIARDSFRLYCTPAINLFPSPARLTLDHTRSEYIVRSDEWDVEHHEVYSVADVEGIEQGPEGRRIRYVPFYSRESALQGYRENPPCYRLRFADVEMSRNNRPLKGKECFISFEDPVVRGESAKVQSVSLRLVCSSRGGASSLKHGDLSQPSEQVPAHVGFSDISPPTPHLDAPLSAKNLWLLVSNLAVGHQSVEKLDRLKSAISLLGRVESDGESATRRLIDNLINLQIDPGVSVIDGVPRRVLRAKLLFDCEPDRVAESYLFGAVVCEFLRSVATINTRLMSTMRFQNAPDQRYDWKWRAGTSLNL